MHSTPLHWQPIRRRRWMRALRWLMCAFLVLGLFPGAAEVVESVAHLVHDGHLPHSEAHELVAVSEDCGDTDEHGCTALSHHCKCCASLSVLPSREPVSVVFALPLSDEKYGSLPDGSPPNDGVEPFLRPPIA